MKKKKNMVKYVLLCLFLLTNEITAGVGWLESKIDHHTTIMVYFDALNSQRNQNIWKSSHRAQ